MNQHGAGNKQGQKATVYTLFLFIKWRQWRILLCDRLIPELRVELDSYVMAQTYVKEGGKEKKRRRIE
jgi:hypothetical protein